MSCAMSLSHFTMHVLDSPSPPMLLKLFTYTFLLYVQKTLQVRTMAIDLDNGGFIVSDEEDNLQEHFHSPGGETSSSSGNEGPHLSQATVDYQDLELAQRARQRRHAARPSRMTVERSTVPTITDRGARLPHTPLPARCRRSSRVTNTWSSGGRTISDSGVHMYVNPVIRRRGQPSLRAQQSTLPNSSQSPYSPSARFSAPTRQHHSSRHART